MARRPNVFSQEEFQASLKRQGCPDNFVKSTTSDFRLFVPLALRELGAEKLCAIAERARAELKLGEQQAFWRDEARYIVGWAEEQIDAYKADK